MLRGVPHDLRATYEENGYYFPVDVVAEEEAAAYVDQLAEFEALASGVRLGNKGQLNYPHVVCRFANEIVRNENLLDAVEAIIGPDILLWGSTFFFKEPRTSSYVSWHQDMRYWGLQDPAALVSAWMALAPVTRDNGCMRFAPGSHKGALVEHKDTFVAENILTRGQKADVEVDEDSVVYVELAPGQVSLHHGYLLHASMPNRSDDRRLGFTMNFIAPHNRQSVATRDYALLLRGEDRYGFFDHYPEPETDLSAASLQWHAKILQAQNEAMYAGINADSAEADTS